jgi:hypothetical protein
MTIARLLTAVVAVLATTVFGFAGPARADQVLEGVYAYAQPDGLGADWTIYPTCVPTVGDLRDNLELPVACTLHVAPTPSTVLVGGDAKLTGGLWTYSNTKKEGLVCGDGSTVPVQETYKFDDAAMSGTRSVAHNAVCGLPASITNYPFTLAYTGPLPMPVDRYPLYCDPNGLKRCR